MSRVCFVARCRQRSSFNNNGEKVTFHSLPKDETLKAKWLRNIHRDMQYFKITKSTKICSRHFKPSDFLSLDSERPRLKANAIPSVFDWDSSINISPIRNQSLNTLKPKSNLSSTNIAPLKSASAGNASTSVVSNANVSTSFESSKSVSTGNVSTSVLSLKSVSSSVYSVKSTTNGNLSTSINSWKSASTSNVFTSVNCSKSASPARSVNSSNSTSPANILGSSQSFKCSLFTNKTSVLRKGGTRETRSISFEDGLDASLDTNYDAPFKLTSTPISTKTRNHCNECAIPCSKCPPLEEKIKALLLENTKLKADLKLKEEEINTILEAIKNEQAKNQHLSSELNSKVASIECIKSSDEDVYFYTGLPNYGRFVSLLTFLNPGENGENITLWCTKKKTKTTESGIGRPRKLSAENQFFLVLMRLRLGLFTRDISHRFGISANTVSRITITWVSYMYLHLGQLCIWPSKDVIERNMPEDFKTHYPNTRLILDATEIKCESAKSLYLQSGTYSNYKSTTTFKGLIGISPDGLVTFVSSLYTGCISDKELTARSGLLKLPFEPTDAIMADKGFTIEDMLKEKGISLNIPAFLRNKDQLDENEIEETQKIASLRIHVERRIKRIKGFHIFDRAIPHTLSPVINEIWTVCAILTNFQGPLVRSNSNENNTSDFDCDLEEIMVPLESFASDGSAGFRMEDQNDSSADTI